MTRKGDRIELNHTTDPHTETAVPWDTPLFPDDDSRDLRDTVTSEDENGTHEIRIPATAKVVSWKHEDFADSGNPDDDIGPVWVDGIPLGVTTWSADAGGSNGTESVVWYSLGQAKRMAELLGAVLETQ